MSNSPPPPSGATIEFTCPRCGAAQRLSASTAGTRQTCSACQQTYKVPAAASGPAMTSPAASPPAKGEPPKSVGADHRPGGLQAAGASRPAGPPVSRPAQPSSTPPPPSRAPAPVAAAPSSPISKPVAPQNAPDHRPSGLQAAGASVPVADVANDDEAPIPFDSDDDPVDVRPVPITALDSVPPKKQAPVAPTPRQSESPAPSVNSAPPVNPAPQGETVTDDHAVDRDAFYDEDASGVGANRPRPKEPAKTVIYIDHKHRVSNDDGLILVVCGICGTRVHFPAAKGETNQQCPDCFTKFRLPKLPAGPVKQESPKLEDLDEFKLEETFERQGYQPMHRDSVSAEAIKGPPPAPGVIGASPVGMPMSGSAPPGVAPMSTASYGNVAGPPMPPPFPAPPFSAPPSGGLSAAPYREPVPPEAAAALSAAGAAPTMINPENRLQRPPNWAILVDVFNFAFRPLHLLALVSFTLLVMAPIILGVLAMAVSDSSVMQILIIAVIPPLEAAPFVFVSSYFVHIVHDSSYGEKHIQHWNAVNLVDNMIMAIYVFCAIFFAGLPGFLISLPFTGAESNTQVILIVVSTAVFFPFCLLSLLEEESYWQVYNHEVALSFRRSANQVFLFLCTLLMFTIACGGLMGLIACTGGIALAGEEGGSVAMTILLMGLIVLVGMYWVMTYGRMVGRLAWVMNYEAQFGVMDDDD